MSASQEGTLSLSSFSLQSKGIGSSGPIAVEGKRDESGNLSQLVVNAFEKKISVAQDVLRKISKYNINGIQLSYESGYKELGGRTVYILFQKGFTSRIIEKTVLAVKENGTSKIVED